MANITLNITNLTKDDVRAARLSINQKNQQITFKNQQIAQQNIQRALNDPPLTPLPLIPFLPMSTAAEIRTSYEPLLAALALQTHNTLVVQATEQALINQTDIQKIRSLAADATPAKRAAALAAYEAAIV